MFEIELKFQVPIRSLAVVRQRLATHMASTVALRARYLDTPDRRLAAAGVALRLRREGRQWVQAFKGMGPDALHRLEHEVPLGVASNPPRIDVTRHRGTAAEPVIDAALGDGDALLELVFETDVSRTLRTVRSAGARVELALDQGEIRAGSRHLPVCELEFELKAGSVDGLLALASRWVGRHQLWLDVRSKAERGVRLAQGVDAGAPVLAGDIRLVPGSTPDAALRAIVAACLAQVLPNAAEVAAGVGSPEHLHQLRVGLRRLRCALRVFGDLSPATDLAWAPALAALFARLGSARDRDALAESVLPGLRLAGAPLAELPPDTAHEDSGVVLRSAGCNLLLLELIGFSQGAGPAGAGPVDAPPDRLASIVQPRLQHLRRQLKEDAHAFDTANDALRHRTRRRLKRLRYSVEFFASLLPARPLKHWLERARPAQDVLGRFNDLAIAELAFRDLLKQDERAGFAVGWLSARRAELVPHASAALIKLAKVPIPDFDAP